VYKSAKSAAQKPLTRAETAEFRVRQILLTLSCAANEARDSLGNRRVNPVILYGMHTISMTYWKGANPMMAPSDSLGHNVPKSKKKTGGHSTINGMNHSELQVHAGELKRNVSDNLN
jgi:hypothetical protein